MSVTVLVNPGSSGLTLCHKGSNGISQATLPDVCKTPSPGGPVPIPYPNTAFSSDLAKGTTTVHADGGNMCANYGSEFAKSTGDEPGTIGGVKSGTFIKEATWMTFSFDVKLEGKGACRLSDKMFHNHENTVNAAGLTQKPLTPEDLIACAMKILCNDAKGRETVKICQSRGITLTGSKPVITYSYKGGKWSTGKASIGGSVGKNGPIALSKATASKKDPCVKAAQTLVHEAAHTKQDPSKPEHRTQVLREIDVRTQTEQWSIDYRSPEYPKGLPESVSGYRTADGKVDSAAIEGSLSALGYSKNDRVIRQLANGNVEAWDPTRGTYERAPEDGDSYFEPEPGAKDEPNEPVPKDQIKCP